jgi:multidomain signaling protein FimX
MSELSKSKENQEKVRALATEARNAGKTTIAEFVEDAGSMSILFSCGVNFVQGNFLQEPQRVMAYDFGS